MTSCSLTEELSVMYESRAFDLVMIMWKIKNYEVLYGEKLERTILRAMRHEGKKAVIFTIKYDADTIWTL